MHPGIAVAIRYRFEGVPRPHRTSAPGGTLKGRTQFVKARRIATIRTRSALQGRSVPAFHGKQDHVTNPRSLALLESGTHRTAYRTATRPSILAECEVPNHNANRAGQNNPGSQIVQDLHRQKRPSDCDKADNDRWTNQRKNTFLHPHTLLEPLVSLEQQFVPFPLSTKASPCMHERCHEILFSYINDL